MHEIENSETVALDFCKQAAIYLNHKQYDAAITACQEALKHQPDSAQACQFLGMALQSQGQDQDAQKWYMKALEIHPNLVDAHANLGVLYAKHQNWELAILSYQKAIENKPDCGVAYRNLSQILIQLNRLEEVTPYWQQALQLKVDFATPEEYFTMGNILLRQEKADEAIECYQHVLQSQPNSFETYHNLAEALQQLEQWEAAVSAYQKAIELKPDSAQTYQRLGDAWVKLQQWEGVIQSYNKVLDLQPDIFQAYHNLAEAFHHLEQWEAATSAYQKAIELKPNSVRIYQRLGDISMKLQQWEEAITFYEKALEIDPNGFEVHQKLAPLLMNQGQPEKALQIYRRAIEVQPFFRWSYLNLWNLFARHKKLGEVLKFYKNAVQRYPEAPLVELNLGEILTRQGKINKAIICYQNVSYKRAKKLHPEAVEQYWDKNYTLAPAFLIIGAQKGGTTSLYRYLEEHPKILSAIKKEINFWNHHYQRGLDWYLAHFPQLSGEHNFITGEATPNYLENPEVIPRIFEAFPQMKLIVILRNPVDRAVSQYHHWIRLGLEYRSLEVAIESELEQLGNYPKTTIQKKYWKDACKYVWRGIYIEFIQKWMATFPKEQFLILRSEDFYTQTPETLQQVFEFLGLPQHAISKFKTYNQGFYQPMPDTIRQQLSDFFQPHNQRLEQFLGMNFNWN